MLRQVFALIRPCLISVFINNCCIFGLYSPQKPHSNMNFSLILKKVLPHVVAIGLFLVVVIVIFYPQLEGKQLYQHDIVMVKACSQEIIKHRADFGEEPLWTSSQFSGMPTFGINQFYPKNLMEYVERALRLGIPRNMSMVLLVFVSFYLLMLSFKVNPWLAIAGAIAFGLSTYWYIALGAGHTSKIRAVDFMAVVLAGVIMAYRGRILWGAAVAGVGTALQVHATHFQITYYLLIILGFYGLFEFINQFLIRPFRKAGTDYLHEKGVKQVSIFQNAGQWSDYMKAGFSGFGSYAVQHLTFKDKEANRFWIATGALVLAAMIGGATNAGKMLSMKEYGDLTIRGKASELSAYKNIQTGESGLDEEYALAWSYGIGETWNLMIPNFLGGASGQPLSKSSAIWEDYLGPAAEAGQIPMASAEANLRQMPTYWGEQTFTSGPVYIGVIMCFLFLFGILTVKGHYKWWLVAATFFAFLLAWGINLRGFNVWMLNNLPFYNKFRAVSMTLVVAQVTIPLLGMLGLAKVFEKPTYKGERKVLTTKLFIAAGITLFFLLVFWLGGTAFFDFKNSVKDAAYQGNPTFYEALVKDRISIFKMDCLRGIGLVVVFAGILLAYLKNWVKMPKLVFIGALAVVVLIDMLPVTMRYMNSSKFSEPLNLEEEFMMTTGDQQIYANEKDAHYRVYYASGSVWKDASVSYRHKSIGGYSAVKLRKYQELFEMLMAPADPKKEPVPGKRNLPAMLNMLNAKWLLQDTQTPLPNGRADRMAQQNPGALGNAWFVGEIKQFSTEDDVIKEMRTFDPAKTAVVNTEKIDDYLSGFTPRLDSNATIKLDSYLPNKMVYSYNAASEQFAVFSEIYYPKGWEITLDGGSELQDHIVVNYVLRGMRLPAGKHTVEFSFKPSTYFMGGNISLVFSLITILGFLGLTGLEVVNWNKRINDEQKKEDEAAKERAEKRKRRTTTAKKRKPKAKE